MLRVSDPESDRSENEPEWNVGEVRFCRVTCTFNDSSTTPSYADESHHDKKEVEQNDAIKQLDACTLTPLFTQRKKANLILKPPIITKKTPSHESWCSLVPFSTELMFYPSVKFFDFTRDNSKHVLWSPGGVIIHRRYIRARLRAVQLSKENLFSKYLDPYHINEDLLLRILYTSALYGIGSLYTLDMIKLFFATERCFFPTPFDFFRRIHGDALRVQLAYKLRNCISDAKELNKSSSEEAQKRILGSPDKSDILWTKLFYPALQIFWRCLSEMERGMYSNTGGLH